MDKIVNELFHGDKLCDSIYQFYQPKVPVQLEVVFVHGLEYDNCGDTYWKTWLARDGTSNNFWPMTWLPDEFPSAKVFALKYDASIKQTPTNGRMDLSLLGEKLIQEMVEFGKIGQNGVPVVFVCHGFGGLVAKQIVISAKNHISHDPKAKKLLKNIGAILFYSTPHHGSHLVKSSSYSFSIWGDVKGPLLENLEVLNPDTSRLNQAFVQVAQEHSKWSFKSVAGMHAMKQCGEMMVEEASSRFELGRYLALSDDHFDVVRPKSKKDSSYLLLTTCLEKILDQYAIKHVEEVDSLVPDGFVGLEVQEKTIKGILQEVPIVGLVGMGGIGKTTLVRAVYQSLYRGFDSSCYLDNIKSKANLDDVLFTLLQKFEIKDRETHCIVERSGLQARKMYLVEDLKTYVQQHRVLVVMDDVGTKENFRSLLMDMGFLNGNKESKVIVTCRNWQELRDFVEGNGKYEVEPMSCGQDIELFVYHAFKGARTMEQGRKKLLHFLSRDSSEDLIDDFESKCNDVVKACGGLPLSLEVMGCYLGSYLMDGDLSSEDYLNYWRGALEKLKRAEPFQGGCDNDRLWKVLQISYDYLHENEKNMFLDIACFFCDSVRYGEQALLRIWGGEPQKLIEFKNLKERCLVKINKEDESMTMHDQLRDMGRSIVRQQCKRVVSEMTRLWAFEDVSKLQQNNEIIAPQIQGLSLYEWGITSTTNIENKSIGISKQLKISKQKGFHLDCPGMRLLNLHEVEEGIIGAISIKDSSCIRWLCLKGINITKLPKFVQVCKNLCVLDMTSCSYLKKLDKSIANLVNLLELNLSNCMRLTSLPDSISKLEKLSTLNLKDCNGLTSLPDSIGKLEKLSTLDLRGCKRLTNLPDSIGKLEKLPTLNLQDCEGLTNLPDSIGKLEKLSTLDLQGCKGLTSLPDSIGKLQKLSTLNLRGCEGVTSLPDSIGKLEKLSTLNLHGCKGLTSLPDSIGKLQKLSTLNLRGGEGVTSLPDSIGKLEKLTTLNLGYCKGLRSLPDSIGKLKKLSTLNLRWCEGLTSLPDSIGKLEKLSTLNLSCCKGLTSLPDSISKLEKLSTLNLWNCEGLTSLPDFIGDMVKLTNLDLSYCKGLTSLPDSIGKLEKLSTLNLGYCKGLTSLPDSIGKLKKLSTLNLSCCNGLTSLPDFLCSMIKLTSLDLSYCKGVTSLLDSIGKLVNLSSLGISSFEGFTSLLDSIGKLEKLSTLKLWGCKGLTSLPDSIGKLEKLSTLYLRGCKTFTSLPDSIGKLEKLSTLKLRDCKGLTSLPNSIGKLEKLSTLNLRGCKGLTSLPDSIGKLKKLSTLDLQGCEGLTSLPDSIHSQVYLNQLFVFGYKGPKSLPNSIN